jgi:hypothetical protein
VIRSTEEEPDCVPAASPWVRRRPSPWPPRAAGPDHPRSSPPAQPADGCAPHPAQIRQVRAGERLRDVRRRFLAYSSPSRSPGLHHLAVPAHPGFVGAAPTLPGTTRIRLPPAPRTCCDRPEAKVSHLHSNHSAGARPRPFRDDTERSHRRLYEACGGMPPAELEAAHYRHHAALAEAGHSTP